MEKVILTFINEAAKASNFHLVLNYQWVLTVYDADDMLMIDDLLKVKARGN